MIPNLTATLHNSDPALLPVLAKRWTVNIQNMNATEMVDALSDGMLDAQRAENVWNSLDDRQRGALQMVLGSGGKMTTPMFERLFGEIRKMGAGRIEREKPHENPASVAEALYYRGLIAEGFEQADTGARPIVYVPPDLAVVLPIHITGYAPEVLGVDMKASDGETLPEPSIEPLEEVANVMQADTSIVDDLTTLLAYLQLHSPEIENNTLAESDRNALMPHLLKQEDVRLGFLLGVGTSADLIEIQEGKAYTKRADVRRWLSGKRAEQLKWLADGWRTSTVYADLWHVPGLHSEAGWAYDPVVARGAIFKFMTDFVPKNEWWSLDEFIITLKEVNPDFQRPAGDYDSWYIRNDEGEYLRGFESWDAIEGALLEFYMLGPMHWLGLVDLAEEAVRLTAYGRAFLSGTGWPAPAEAEEKIAVQQDGTLLASRKVPRIDRFQLARFTTWQAAGDPYRYKFDAAGIERAGEQGITTEHIGAFIARMIGTAPVPPIITRLLSTWQGGPTTAVSIERVLVLRTTGPETLDRIWDTPALRRFLGARLGTMAAIVRADQWEGLRDALGVEGIKVDVMD